MGDIEEFSQLCRLCLVKEEVNVPIFDESSDIRQTFLKISSCLPVKVSPEDNLPKKICDGCSYKLDMLYVFRNTSVDSEKQLLSWLDQAGLDGETVKDGLGAKAEVMVKQEAFEPIDTRIEDGEEGSDIGVDAQSYIIQQQQLSYEQDFSYGEEDEPTDPTVDPIATDEPAPKRAKRNASKRPVLDETEDELDSALHITKAEDDDEDVDQHDYLEATEAPSTSADDQPGPSGVGKGTVEAPSSDSLVNFACTICLCQFPNKLQFLKHHYPNMAFTCCKCQEQFKSAPDLYAHLEVHRTEPDDLGDEEVDESEDLTDQVALSYQTEEAEGDELIYILEESVEGDEVVIEEDDQPDMQEMAEERGKSDDVTIVQLEHGYVIPNAEEVEDHEMAELVTLNGKQKFSFKPSTSKMVVTQSRPRAPQPKRRHVVPDFSSTNYLFVNATEEVNIPHYKCLRCEQLFINKFVFFRHIERGKCYINHCDVCTATFTKNSDFYSHYLAQHTDRAICNFCFRTFMYEKNVKDHMMRHLDQFRHRCEKCNKGFYTIREYRNHYKNRHMGIKHVCTICSRSFADEYYFKRHVAAHETSTGSLE